MAFYEIPLTAEPQNLSIQLGDTEYVLQVEWGYAVQVWLVHLNDSNGVRLISSIPLVSGNDLLEPYAYMNLGGALYAYTTGEYVVPPSFDNLGGLGQVIFVTP